MNLVRYTFESFSEIQEVDYFFVTTEEKKYSIFENHLPCILKLVDAEIEYAVDGSAKQVKITDLNGMLYFEDNTLTLISKH
jgi:F0F1-type ATP synthase epsilon subunit